MSTVVDNDKYIINGSTLSEIGDAIRGQMPDQYETVTVDAVCYIYTDSVNGSGTLLNLTEETIQGWYHNTLPSPITAVKIIMTSNEYSDYSAYVEVNGQRKDLTKNKSYTYSLPITIRGSSPSYTTNRYTFKIYPLNGDNYLSWDSNYYYPSSSSDYNAHLYKEEVSYKRLLPKPNFLVSDIAQKIVNLNHIPIDYEGLSYGYITIGGEFYSNNEKNSFLTFIPLNTGQKIGFCIGETVSNRLRAGFFSGKTYNNFSQYVENSSSNSQIYSGGIYITGDTELSGDGLLKRFYYTAPSNGELIITTSNDKTSAHLHVWRA